MADVIRKQFAADLTVAPGERAVTARISTMAVDRDGEVLIPQGCDAGDFLKSPTVFYNHDYQQPIGRCEAIHRGATAIEAKTRFAERPANHGGPWLADTVLSLLQQRVISGFSVGFVPIEGRHPSRRDREVFGAAVRYVFSKWKLLEYSVAPLPANQDALALAVSKGVLSAEAARMILADFQPAPRRRRKAALVLAEARKPREMDLAALVRRQVLRARGAIYDFDEPAT